jgi:antirestriction protein ArdC
VPREKRAAEEEKHMTEETRTQQTQSQPVPAKAGHQGLTGVARSSAERKPMISWAALLREAVSKPGYIHAAYGRFHSYSLGNQLLALFQCFERGLQPGPLATFSKWKELGRHVKKGEKALTLCIPVLGKRKATVRADDGIEREEDLPFTHFTYKAHFFVIGQTDGAEYTPTLMPAWDEATALAALGVKRQEFEHPNGNVQGYAKKGRRLAVSPIAALPSKTLFHELAHCLMHVDEIGDLSDSETITHAMAEVEAEAVALLCCESLGLPGAEFARGYIQSWAKGQTISERSSQRIFRAADQVLRAGRAVQAANDAYELINGG